jgi:phospholipid/cholesterol/gamma-HCH transport system substrate-binding protein
MITRATKVKLLVFVVITLLGVSYVGARYARLDRLFYDDTYTVAAQFAESGGIFVDAEVTYRGVRVGRVEDMRVVDDGVAVDLGIDKAHDSIPADVRAVVANRSAIGEQYVDLQPQSSGGPYLEDGSRIDLEHTSTPISTTTLLVDLDALVNSVDRRDLRTVVSELGQAFYGTGPELGRIIDTGNSFIETAMAKLEVTKELIRDSRVALQTQLDSESAIRSFSHDLRLFSQTLVDSDQDLRDVIAKGSRAARDVRSLIEDNQDDLAGLLNNLITTNEITTARLDGIEQVLVLYPYVVEGGYTVVARDPLTGLYDAHFGMVFTQDPPVCHEGYGTRQRSPNDREERPMDLDARCTEPPTQSNARGAQNAPAYNRSPVVAAYDPTTNRLRAASRDPDGGRVVGGGEEALLGEDSWKWLLVAPLAREDR